MKTNTKILIGIGVAAAATTAIAYGIYRQLKAIRSLNIDVEDELPDEEEALEEAEEVEAVEEAEEVATEEVAEEVAEEAFETEATEAAEEAVAD